MGTYLYTTSPAAMADIVVEYKDGRTAIRTAHLYKYASKPYGIVDDYSEGLVRRAENLFKRTATPVMALGVLVYGLTSKRQTLEIGSPVFETHGWVSRLDDNEKSIGRVKEVIRKPRNVAVKPDSTPPGSFTRQTVMEGLRAAPDSSARNIAMNLLDNITGDYTAFVSFLEMANAPGGYRPTIRCNDSRAWPKAEDRANLLLLADAYDYCMTRRGDDRRAYRG